MKRINITCPACGSKAYLRPASVVYGDKAPDPDAKYYVCGRYPACDCYVAAHRKTMLPMGTLADKALRKKRHDAHVALDSLWKNGIMSRKEAYRLLQRDFEMPAIDIHMYKHIPTGAGLGGGSSDCAFMIKLLNDKFSLGLSTEQMEAYAAQPGADCAFFVRNKPVFATGIGNVFQSIDLSLEGYHIVLVKPDIFVSTRDAFAQITPHRPEVSLTEIIRKPVEEWKEWMVNDFEASVFAKYPEIKALKERMYELGAVYAAMSGSGSSVYGLFKNSLEDVDTHFPGCFCRQRKME